MLKQKSEQTCLKKSCWNDLDAVNEALLDIGTNVGSSLLTTAICKLFALKLYLSECIYF